MITNDSSEEEYSFVGAISAGHGTTPLEYIYYESSMLVDTDHKPLTAIFKDSLEWHSLLPSETQAKALDIYLCFGIYCTGIFICKMLNCCMHLSTRKKAVYIKGECDTRFCSPNPFHCFRTKRTTYPYKLQMKIL